MIPVTVEALRAEVTKLNKKAGLLLVQAERKETPEADKSALRTAAIEALLDIHNMLNPPRPPAAILTPGLVPAS